MHIKDGMLIATVATSLLVGCDDWDKMNVDGGDDDDEPDVVNDAVDDAVDDTTSAALAGTWSAGCEPVVEGGGLQLGDDVQGVASRETVILDRDGPLVRRLEMYADAGCTQLVASRVLRGTFEAQATPNVTGAAVPLEGSLDVTVTDVTVTAYTPEAVDAMNEESYCEVDDWEAGVGLSVAGADCPEGTVAAGDEQEESFSLQGDRLFLAPDELGLSGRDGAPSDGSPDLSRPFVRLPGTLTLRGV